MNKYGIFTVAMVILIIFGGSQSVFAQQQTSDLPFVVVTNAGAASFQEKEATFDDGLLNPANLPEVGKLGKKGFASTSWGITTFPSGQVNSNAFCLGGKGVNKKLFFNVNYYRNESPGLTFVESSSLAGSTAKFTVNTVEFAGAYKLSDDLNIGAAWVVEDKCDLKVKFGDQPLFDATTKSPINYRLGFQYKPGKWTIASVYGFRKDDISLTQYPAMTGLPDNIPSNSTYETVTWTHGVAYNFSPATSLFYDHQFSTTYKPEGMVENTDSSYWGGQQWFTPHFNIRIVSKGGIPQYTLNYYNRGFYFFLQYQNGMDSLVQDLVGKPTKTLIGVGTYF